MQKSEKRKKTLHKRKLSEQDVREIRKALANNEASYRYLAEKYGVTHGAIYQIKIGKRIR